MSTYTATWAEHQARNAAQPVDVQVDIAARRRRAESSERFIGRISICIRCGYYRDDDDGKPLDPPCVLHIPWSRCQWKRQAASETPVIDDGCLWYNHTEGVLPKGKP